MEAETLALLDKVIFACFIGTWIVLGIIAFSFFHLGKDAALKRKWFPRFVILVAVLFVLFSSALTALSSPSLGDMKLLVVVLPVISLITYLNIKLTKFCGKCGATLYPQSFLTPSKFCPKCGAELDPKPGVRDDLIG